MKKVLLLVGLFMAMLSAPTYAQDHGVCGVTHEHGLQIKKRLLENRKAYPDFTYTRGSTKYVPVKVHLVGTDDTPSSATEGQVIDMMCILNEQWEDLDIQFYLSEEIGYINNSQLANHEGFTQQYGNILIWEKANEFKTDDAINVFVTNNAGGGGVGTTLAYYIEGQNYKYDFVVIRRQNMLGASVLPHEMGHFFSLPHPFFGWDSQEWDEGMHGLQVGPSSPSGIPNERVNDPNCATVADGMCDTPPDYLFAFSDGQNGCSPWTGGTMDPDGVVIDPLEDNMMSYFAPCPNYVFTDDQMTAVQNDLETPARSYLVNGVAPNLDVVSESVELISPIGVQVPFNAVWFEWEEVPGATQYIIEASTNGTFDSNTIRKVVSTTSTMLSDLIPNVANYFWRVRPFNEYSFCDAGFSTNSTFSTNAIETSVSNVQGLNDWNLRPNPASASDMILVDVETMTALDATINIYAATGQLVSSFENNFAKGSNTVEVPTTTMSAGIYMVSIQTKTGITTKRLVIR